MTAWYVYGVVAADAAPPEGTWLVERGPLAAVTSQVSLAEFGEDALPARLEDRAWLEEKALAHESVLQAFVGVTPVVPLRFGTIYRDAADVRQLLEDRAAFFEEVLERVRGCVEIGVKAWYDPARVAQPVGAGGGRAYLERRRGELSSARDASGIAAAAHERLSALAQGAVVNRPQPRELTGRDEKMLLNAAYLVREGDERLRDEVARLSEEHGGAGVTFETTGPWPPYNFARDEEPDA